ncbi:MAG: DUF4382 domain-containing protein [Gammaproteobacteria bacterium]|nr:DUF4382 domain-containing protein [Gammaproteobacteria bacterium]
MKTRTGFLVISMLALSGLALMLTACGGGGGSSTGALNLSLTDAPVDEAEEVVVNFIGVELQPAGGERIMFDFTAEGEMCETDPLPCMIDLTDYTDGDSVLLLDSVTVPAGQYSWMRLILAEDPGYIVINGEQSPLQIPSGAQTGLKLHSGFVVAAASVTDYTVDFDLRKSVHLPSCDGCDYKLRPTLRLIDNLEVGTLTGTVDPALITQDCSGAVYVFDGSVIEPDDEDGEGVGGPDPIASARVSNDGVYGYTVGFLLEGDYLVTFTCDALNDTEADEVINFAGTDSVHIFAGETTPHDIVPAVPLLPVPDPV